MNLYKIIITWSRKLGIRLFLLMFVALTIASIFKVDESYKMIICFFCFFPAGIFFSLMLLPPQFSKAYLKDWFFFFSLFITFISAGIVFFLVLFYKIDPNHNTFAMANVFVFMAGVFLTLISGIIR